MPSTLVSRAHLGRRLRRHRRDASRARRPSRSAATASSPGARPTSPPTSRISIASGSTRPARIAEFRGAQEPITVDSGNDRVKGARAGARSTSASRGTARSSPTRSTPTTPSRRRRRSRRRSSRSRSAGPRSTPTTRTVAAFLKLNEARNWNEFTGGAARLRRAVAEFRLRRRRRPHRLLRAGPHSDSRVRRRLAAGRRLDRRRRVDRLDAVRRAAASSTIRRSTSSSPPIIGPAPASIRYNLGLEWTEPYPRAADHRSAARDQRDVHAGRFRAHPGRHAVAAREDAAAAAAAACAAADAPRSAGARPAARSGTSTRRGDSAAAAIFQAWFLQLAPALAGDELGPAVTDTLRRAVLVRHALPRQHARRPNDVAVVRRRDDARSARPATTR